MAGKSKKTFLNIRKSMLEYDMNYSDLAKLVGLTTSAISKRMANKLSWKLPELKVMAKKFNKSIDELVA